MKKYKFTTYTLNQIWRHNQQMIKNNQKDKIILFDKKTEKQIIDELLENCYLFKEYVDYGKKLSRKVEFWELTHNEIIYVIKNKNKINLKVVEIDV